MINLSPNELKLIAKSTGVKNYESKSDDDSIKILGEPKKTKKNKSFWKYNKIYQKIFCELRQKFLKPKVKEIRKNLYEIENKKNLSKSKNNRDWRKYF